MTLSLTHINMHVCITDLALTYAILMIIIEIYNSNYNNRFKSKYCLCIYSYGIVLLHYSAI